MSEVYFIPVLIAGGILFLIFLFFIVFYMFIQKRRTQLHMLEKERMKFDHNLNLMTERLNEQERAMSQISREVHDNVSQKMDFLLMNIKAIKESGLQMEDNRPLENSFNLAEQIGNDLRNISYSLNSDYVTAQGLAPVIQKELDYISTSRRIGCQLDLVGDRKQIADDRELLIYRIVQEVLHNSIKHSGATEILVNMRYTLEQLSIKISDNGTGFDTTATDYQPGLGFKNMQQRAKLLGATLDIGSSVDTGTRIMLSVPYTFNAMK